MLTNGDALLMAHHSRKQIYKRKYDTHNNLHVSPSLGGGGIIYRMPSFRLGFFSGNDTIRAVSLLHLPA